MKDFQFCLLIATLFLIGSVIADSSALMILCFVWTVIAGLQLFFGNE